MNWFTYFSIWLLIGTNIILVATIFLFILAINKHSDREMLENKTRNQHDNISKAERAYLPMTDDIRECDKDMWDD